MTNQNPYEPPKAAVDDLTPKGKLIPTTCIYCGHGFTGVATKTFLGFQRFKCERCRMEFTGPLFMGHRITYWVLLILSTVLALGRSGATLNIFVVLMAIAVIIDAFRLWKRRR